MHHNGRGLDADVAAHGRNKRDEQGEFRVAFDVEGPNDIGTADTSAQADEQPRQTCPGEGPNAVLAFDVFRDPGGQLVVALGIFNQYVDGIVNGDPAKQHAFVVDDGKGDEVVALHEFDHHFFTLVGAHRHQVVVVFQVLQNGPCGGRVQQEALEGQTPIQSPPVVHHVDGVDVFDVRGLCADFTDGPRHGPVFLDLDHFHGHQGTRGAFFVAQQFEDLRRRFDIVDHAHGFLDLGLWEVGQSVSGIVGIQSLDDVLGNLLGAQRGEQLFTHVFFELGNDFGLQVGVQQAVEVQGLLALERVENVGHVLRVELAYTGGEFHVSSRFNLRSKRVEEVFGQLEHGAKVRADSGCGTQEDRLARKKLVSKAAASSARSPP